MLNNIIQKSFIEFESLRNQSSTKRDPLIPTLFPDEPHLRFGTLKIKIADLPMTKEPQFILFTNDCSGSMDDICSDGRTKMEHSNHTICNIIKMIAMYEETEIWIQVNAFDDQLYEIIPPTRVSPSNILELIQKVNQIVPRNATNLELALKSTSTSTFGKSGAKSYANISNNIISEHEDLSEAFGSYFVTTFFKGGKGCNEVRAKTHILTTDGNTTKGCKDNKKLASYVNTDFNNIFIGLGTDHSAETLLSLASNKNSQYYFIDSIENGGIAFAEIIHTILYKCVTDIQIKTIHSELYDFEKGEWTTFLRMDSWPSDVERTYHIRTTDTTDLRDIEVLIFGTSVISDKDSIPNALLDVVYCLPGLIPLHPNPDPNPDPNTDPDSDSDSDSDTDPDPHIVKYIFRQRTQELLYQARKNQL